MERYRQNQQRVTPTSHTSSADNNSDAGAPIINTSPTKEPSAKHSSGFFPVNPSASVKMLIVALIIASFTVTVALGGSLVKSLTGSDASNTNYVNAQKYQAVFLDNGQVYFGKILTMDNEYIKLSNIYYLQVEQQVQPEQQKEDAKPETANNAEGEKPKISLARLGKELHGPEDEMFIRKDKVVFWENLKDEGQVVTAIKEYEKTQGNQ